MSAMTRRDLARVLAGAAGARVLRGDQPALTVSGVDHLKLRVASAGASAMFYYGLFGGEMASLRNSTLPDSPRVDEFFLKIGAASFPYLMFSEITAGQRPGLDHVSVLAGNPGEIRQALARNGVSLIDPDRGLWLRDADGTLIELMTRPTWGGIAPSVRLALPANLGSVRPAFEPVAIRRTWLGAPDVDRSANFYSRLFGHESAQPPAGGGRAFTWGAVVVELRPAQAPGLDRLVIAVRHLRTKEARRILEQRGIEPHGSRNETLFRDPDGNELELVAS